MRDLFICPRNSMRADWLGACPDAKLYKSVKSVRLSKKMEYLFWLHADADSLHWILDNILQIRTDFENPRIVVLANVPEQTDAMLSLAQGAMGYCHAYSTAEQLKEVKTVVMHGGLWVGSDLLKTLINATQTKVGNSARAVAENLALLTKREKEVSIQASKGLSNKEIARVLKITERTVKAHLSASFERLGVKDRLQLALMLSEKSSN